ncbi:hypothetical protein GJ654_06845 [Rhodoblastus acidophilus]|jgi:hypothetical protein|uniref:Uncharacterized protein n=1 Tax=Rhodoblastus acidophilus TaxID=1074 RepID=A0A6N8DK03_RHOAC|nr:hypothetical protein [Rhodoblastus acidophilus]MCW2274143.1 hypothetical protein [Rhodoblastus acidophilus]MTV30707.1 hypothetical protein [Rhodoblastus acidophilus]
MAGIAFRIISGQMGEHSRYFRPIVALIPAKESRKPFGISQGIRGLCGSHQAGKQEAPHAAHAGLSF